MKVRACDISLDFHPYCHAVVHWNLPSNPVDLEQREGRVHRYKGHAVRKNVASVVRKNGHAPAPGANPWPGLFKSAEKHAHRTSEIVPYWVFPVEDGAYIERHAPTAAKRPGYLHCAVRLPSTAWSSDNRGKKTYLSI
jgi:hypothetical protein